MLTRTGIMDDISVSLMLFPVDTLIHIINVWLVHFRKDDGDHCVFTLRKDCSCNGIWR